MTLSMNQFELQPVAGDLSLPRTGMTISAQISSNENGTITPGQPLKLDTATTTTGVPQLLALTSNSNATFGIAIRNLKDASWVAGNPLEIAMNNDVIWMTAGAAITAGSYVEAVYTTSKVVTNTGVNPSIGKALNSAAGDGSLVRILIQVPAEESATA